jgi:hypothetical protein
MGVPPGTAHPTTPRPGRIEKSNHRNAGQSAELLNSSMPSRPRTAASVTFTLALLNPATRSVRPGPAAAALLRPSENSRIVNGRKDGALDAVSARNHTSNPVGSSVMANARQLSAAPGRQNARAPGGDCAYAPAGTFRAAAMHAAAAARITRASYIGRS